MTSPVCSKWDQSTPPPAAPRAAPPISAGEARIAPESSARNAARLSAGPAGSTPAFERDFPSATMSRTWTSPASAPLSLNKNAFLFVPCGNGSFRTTMAPLALIPSALTIISAAASRYGFPAGRGMNPISLFCEFRNIMPVLSGCRCCTTASAMPGLSIFGSTGFLSFCSTRSFIGRDLFLSVPFMAVPAASAGVALVNGLYFVPAIRTDSASIPFSLSIPSSTGATLRSPGSAPAPDRLRDPLG